MALVKNTNSYATRAEADTYFADRAYATDWTGATDADKDKALILATTKIDMRDFYGTRTDTTTPQALKFPRSGLPLVDGIQYDSDEVPEPIINATFEEALISIATNPTSTPRENQYRRVQLGKMEVEYRDTAVSWRRSLVNGYLKGFVKYESGLVHA